MMKESDKDKFGCKYYFWLYGARCRLKKCKGMALRDNACRDNCPSYKPIKSWNDLVKSVSIKEGK